MEKEVGYVNCEVSERHLIGNMEKEAGYVNCEVRERHLIGNMEREASYRKHGERGRLCEL